jgi:hypothetical protein
MEDTELIEYLKSEGYYQLREIPGRGVCGLHRFIFTVGLMVGLDRTGYKGRYCYESNAQAKEALETWDGIGDPSGTWIKYKGIGGERSNPIHKEEI